MRGNMHAKTPKRPELRPGISPPDDGVLLCKDCVHFTRDFPPMCQAKMYEVIDPVYGRIETRGEAVPYKARESKDHCGPTGKFWVKREEPPVTPVAGFWDSAKKVLRFLPLALLAIHYVITHLGEI